MIAFHPDRCCSAAATFPMILAIHPSPDLVLESREILYGKIEVYGYYGKEQLRGPNRCWTSKDAERRTKVWHRAHAPKDLMQGGKLAQ
jgi:hypothetical protein